MQRPIERLFQFELKFKVLVFVEGGKPENRERNPQSKTETKKRTHLMYNNGGKLQTVAALEDGMHSHQCAILSPLAA